MAHCKRKTREENPFLIAEQFAGIVDTLFVRYTGKTLGGLAGDWPIIAMPMAISGNLA